EVVAPENILGRRRSKESLRRERLHRAVSPSRGDERDDGRSAFLSECDGLQQPGVLFLRGHERRRYKKKDAKRHAAATKSLGGLREVIGRHALVQGVQGGGMHGLETDRDF